MLLIVEKGNEDKVNEIFHRWDLHAVVIGHVTDDGILRVLENGKTMGEVSVARLNDPPQYTRDGQIPSYFDSLREKDLKTVPEPENYYKTFLEMIGSPNIASKEWVYEQYDQQVQTNSVVLPGADSGVIRIKGTKKAIALTTDSNGTYCYLNPNTGSKIIIAEAARNLVAQGAEPIAVTDGLNFGNPEKLDVYWQLEESIKGISEACRALDTPIISGNASLYNETPEAAIYPTPIVGMVGLIDDVEYIQTPGFKSEGDIIFLIGDTYPEIGGSEYLKHIHEITGGEIPKIDLETERLVQKSVLQAIRAGLTKSVHDLGDGGLAVALAESAIMGEKGAKIEIDTDLRLDEFLFSESQSRFLVSCASEEGKSLVEHFQKNGVVISEIGHVQSEKLTVILKNSERIDLPLQELNKAYYGYLPSLMNI